MYKEKTVLALIPARGGSKGVPQKNRKPIAGKPLIEWTIDAALRSGCCDRIVVSTDDTTIASIARAAGADVPFLRPAALATDSAINFDVLMHALGEIERNDHAYDIVLYLQ